MFCQKCGSEVTEGSIFCTKCGEKLFTGNPVQQGTGNYAPALTPTQEIYRLLKMKSVRCPKIKKVIYQGNSDVTIVKGSAYAYRVNISNGKPVVKVAVGGLSSILFGIICGIMAYIGSSFGYGSNFEDICPEVGGVLLCGGIIGWGISLFGDDEKKMILPFIHEALGITFVNEKLKSAGTIVFLTIALVGLIMLACPSLFRLA